MRDVQSEMPANTPRRVDVSVPQTGDEVAACRLQNLCLVGHPDRIRRADCHDAIAFDEHGLVINDRPVGHVHDACAADGEVGWLRVRVRPQQETEGAQERFHDLTSQGH